MGSPEPLEWKETARVYNHILHWAPPRNLEVRGEANEPELEGQGGCVEEGLPTFKIIHSCQN